LWWTKWHWDRFFSQLSVFPCRFHSTGAPLIVKLGTKKLLIFITGVAQKALRLRCEGPSSQTGKNSGEGKVMGSGRRGSVLNGWAALRQNFDDVGRAA
jgi:hypothetical protein